MCYCSRCKDNNINPCRFPQSLREPTVDWTKPILTREGRHANYLGCVGSGGDNARDFQVVVGPGAPNAYIAYRTALGRIHTDRTDKADIVNVPEPPPYAIVAQLQEANFQQSQKIHELEAKLQAANERIVKANLSLAKIRQIAD